MEKEVETYLANLTKHEFNRKVASYLLSIEDILIHVAVENIYHIWEMEVTLSTE